MLECKSIDTPTAADRKRFREVAKSLKRSTLYVSNGIVYYVNTLGKVVQERLREGATRSEISKVIRRIRAEQGIP